MKVLFLSNDWILWFWNQYSMILVMVPTIIVGSLKILAILLPSAKTDKIRELIEIWFLKKEGGKE